MIFEVLFNSRHSMILWFRTFSADHIFFPSHTDPMTLQPFWLFEYLYHLGRFLITYNYHHWINRRGGFRPWVRRSGKIPTIVTDVCITRPRNFKRKWYLYFWIMMRCNSVIPKMFEILYFLTLLIFFFFFNCFSFIRREFKWKMELLSYQCWICQTLASINVWQKTSTILFMPVLNWGL